jgi:hypothetical protein
MDYLEKKSSHGRAWPALRPAKENAYYIAPPNLPRGRLKFVSLPIDNYY